MPKLNVTVYPGPEHPVSARARITRTIMGRRIALTALATVVASAAVPLMNASAMAPAAGPPVAPKAQPANPGPNEPYVGQVSCQPKAWPGTAKLADKLVKTYPGTGPAGTFRYCVEAQSEHQDGRAIDWMLGREDYPAARNFLAWATADGGKNARRLGIMYMIFDHKMWRAYDQSRGWAWYGGANPHTDHVHISLTWNGAMGRTSFWTGKTNPSTDFGPCKKYTNEWAPLHPPTGSFSKPCPWPTQAAPASPRNREQIGNSNSNVKYAQQRLKITADGGFGVGTWNAVQAYQHEQNLPITGVLDSATWKKLIVTPGSGSTASPWAAPTAIPTTATSMKTHATPDPSNPEYTPPTAQAKVLGPDAPYVVDVPAQYRVSRYEDYRTKTLKRGDKGVPVERLQLALRNKDRDGNYGPLTQWKVKSVQTRYKVGQDLGVTDTETWNVLVRREEPSLPYRKYQLREKNRGEAVKLFEKLMGRKVDGYMGRWDVKAVKTLQAKRGLPVTGQVDPRTWANIDYVTRDSRR